MTDKPARGKPTPTVPVELSVREISNPVLGSIALIGRKHIKSLLLLYCFTGTIMLLCCCQQHASNELSAVGMLRSGNVLGEEEVMQDGEVVGVAMVCGDHQVATGPRFEATICWLRF